MCPKKPSSLRQHQLDAAAISDAARCLIARELKEVRCFLKTAAKSAHQDIEHVHRLRVATRQASGTLEVFREIVKPKPLRKIIRHLKKIRASAGMARDLDVFLELHPTLESDNAKLIKSLRKKRKRAQKPIAAMYEASRGNSDFRQQCEKLLGALKLQKSAGQPTFSKRVKPRLQTYANEFFNQINIDLDDLKQLHKFRIGAKKLRYRLNALSPAFPPGTFVKIEKRFKKLQNLLGAINDRAIAVNRLNELKLDGKPVTDKLIDQEMEALESVKQKFNKFWQPETISKIRSQFVKVLQGNQ